MSILHPPAYKSEQFTFIPENNRYVCEESDLASLASGGAFGRVYDDAADAGLTFVLPDGKSIVFVIQSTEYRRGELAYWDLFPADGKSVGFTLRVFND